MINIWATWCGPCVSELPALQSLYTQLPSNVNMMTWCNDSGSALARAKQLLNNVGSTFYSLKWNSRLNSITSWLQFLPSTVFVDRYGNQVGGVVTGAHSASGYMNLIRDRLAMLGLDGGNCDEVENVGGLAVVCEK
ncbi:MAG: hypothetical protein KIG43_06410 [Eubacteriales bacterium]|nr:hypothetical protein [Eubacteriales bacterium]